MDGAVNKLAGQLVDWKISEWELDGGKFSKWVVLLTVILIVPVYI
jgi:hypothetical protein